MDDAPGMVHIESRAPGAFLRLSRADSRATLLGLARLLAPLEKYGTRCEKPRKRRAARLLLSAKYRDIDFLFCIFSATFSQIFLLEACNKSGIFF